MSTIRTYNEDELVGLLKSRDSSAYSYLYDHYARSLYTVIAQIVPDVSAANDVLQETFIHVWTKIDTYDPRKGRLFTWLLQIARHAAIDALRSKGYQRARSNVSLTDDHSAAGNGGSTTTNIDNIGLRKVLEKLSDENRALINLSYFKGYTHEQIAELEGMPLGTVKTKIRNALLQLREYLK